MIIMERKAFTLKPSRETVSCPATLFLLVPLLGIGDVNRLARRHVWKNGVGGPLCYVFKGKKKKTSRANT